MMMKTIAVAGALLIASALTASAEPVYIFKDVRSPAGHARSQAVKFADGRACGASATHEISAAKTSALVKCMSSYGWAVARIVPDRTAQTLQARNQPTVTHSYDDSDDDWETQNENDTVAQQSNDDEQSALDAANAGYAQDAADAAATVAAAASFDAHMTVGN